MLQFPKTKRDELTERMMTSPQIGDHLTEMYCFHLFVVDRQGDTVTTMEASAPCTFPRDGKIRAQTVDEFRARFAYAHRADAYWISAVGRENVQGWYTPEAQYGYA